MKTRFYEMLTTGFPSWTVKNYSAFLKAIRKRDINDIAGITADIEEKSLQEVQDYMKQYLVKFRTLKEKDLIVRKLQEKDFDEKNAETIQKFDISNDYCLFVQDNHYYNRNTYLAMIQKAHDKMTGSNSQRPAGISEGGML